MSFDAERVRSAFPALAEGAAHFDGPGGSQTPRVVADAVAATMTSAIANRGQVTAAERRAEQVVVEARQAMADLVGADPRGVVFGRSMTALTFDLSRTLADEWGPGDEVVVTSLDHDANIRPWVIAAERAEARVRWAHFDPETGELPVQAVLDEVGERTRLVAISGAANLIGTRPDVRAIADAAHEVGALVHLDGVHLAAHAPIDVAALGADVFACSPYKFFGPHCGVMVADPSLLETWHPDKLLPSSQAVPERFELGTLPYELLAGTTATVDFIAGLDATASGSRRDRVLTSMASAEGYEDSLREELEGGLARIEGLVLHSRAAHRTPTLLLTAQGVDSAALSRHLAAVGVNAPASHFYAIEASRRLGLGEAGGVRVGLAPYTDRSDVDRLLSALDDGVRQLRR